MIKTPLSKGYFENITSFNHISIKPDSDVSECDQVEFVFVRWGTNC